MDYEVTASLQDLNLRRRREHLKSPADENFLLDLNLYLREREIQLYGDYPESYPILFVLGVPRSGTTLLAQLIAHSFDIGYINNFIARFWLAPVTGIRLSKILFTEKHTDYQSRYATTGHITDLHAFGYFWRHWFRAETLTDFARAQERAAEIDWPGLRRTLLNIQHEFDRPLVFKNLFGGYYIERLLRLLGKAVFVYIERDPVDSAISILKARREYYDDPNLWWSTVPPEYEWLKDRPYMEQIAGQVYYLRRLYRQQISAVGQERVISLTYRELCASPAGILRRIQERCRQWFGVEIEMTATPPESFPFRTYDDPTSRAAFRRLLDRFERDAQ